MAIEIDCRWNNKMRATESPNKETLHLAGQRQNWLYPHNIHSQTNQSGHWLRSTLASNRKCTTIAKYRDQQMTQFDFSSWPIFAHLLQYHGNLLSHGWRSRWRWPRHAQLTGYRTRESRNEPHDNFTRRTKKGQWQFQYLLKCLNSNCQWQE